MSQKCAVLSVMPAGTITLCLNQVIRMLALNIRAIVHTVNLLDFSYAPSTSLTSVTMAEQKRNAKYLFKFK